jgi:hypothetical protein
MKPKDYLESIEEEFIQLKISRKNLEWLVCICLTEKNPPISIGRGKELLGFKYMDEMRDFLNKAIDGGIDNV